MKKQKIMFTWLIAVLCVFKLVLPAEATNNQFVHNVKSVDEIRKRITTTVIVEDLISGEKLSYELDNKNLDIYTGMSNNSEVTVVVDVGQSALTRDPSQSNSNTFYGWKGNVRISWYDDGTYARLTSAGGDWTRVSGSYSMSNKYIRYGQSLSTNGRSARADFTNSYNVAPGWPSGKYGQGDFVGANINGVVNNQSVTIICNYTLF